MVEKGQCRCNNSLRTADFWIAMLQRPTQLFHCYPYRLGFQGPTAGCPFFHTNGRHTWPFHRVCKASSHVWPFYLGCTAWCPACKWNGWKTHQQRSVSQEYTSEKFLREKKIDKWMNFIKFVIHRVILGRAQYFVAKIGEPHNNFISCSLHNGWIHGHMMNGDR